MSDISYKDEMRREAALDYAIKNCDSEKLATLVVEDAKVFYEFLKGKDKPKSKAKTGAS